MVLKYFSDGSLRSNLAKIYKTMNWRHRINVLSKVSQNLDLIHRAGMIHRDVHSGNVLFDGYMGSLGDFGLSYPAGAPRDLTKRYGVLSYIAPEVLRNEPYTKASDIYSFGMILWEVCHGKPVYANVPFNIALALRICSGERPIISRKVPNCLRELMERCWHDDPLMRPNGQQLYRSILDCLLVVNDLPEPDHDINEVTETYPSEGPSDANYDTPKFTSKCLPVVDDELLVDYKSRQVDMTLEMNDFNV